MELRKKLVLGSPRDSVETINAKAGRKVYMLNKWPRQVITDRAYMKSVNFKIQNQFAPGKSNIGAVLQNAENVLKLDEENNKFELILKALTSIPDLRQDMFMIQDQVEGIFDLEEMRWISFDELVKESDFENFDKECQQRVCEVIHKQGLSMEIMFFKLIDAIEECGRYLVFTCDDRREYIRKIYYEEDPDVQFQLDMDCAADMIVFKKTLELEGKTV